MLSKLDSCLGISPPMTIPADDDGEIPGGATPGGPNCEADHKSLSRPVSAVDLPEHVEANA